jgi:aminoglycoside phosphotransferase family enzyme
MAPEPPSPGDIDAFLRRRLGEPVAFEVLPGKDGIAVRVTQEGTSKELLLEPYASRLARIAESGELTGEDEAAARDLADALAALHRQRAFEPQMYSKRLRLELDGFLASLEELARREELTEDEVSEQAVKAARWWGRLRNHAGRQAPLWGGGCPDDIWVSGPAALPGNGRAEFGEPARDVAAVCFLYLDAALASMNRFDGPFRHLFLAFFGRYLEASGDDEVLVVLPFHIAARALRAANDFIAKEDTGPRKRRYIDLAWNSLEEEEFRVEDLPDLLR